MENSTVTANPIVKYETGEYVVAQGSGICRVEDIRTETFCGTERKYYILKPVYDNFSTVYTPVDCSDLEKRMRRLLSADDINSVIMRTEHSTNSWIENSKVRSEKFAEILANGDRSEVLWLVKVLTMHKLEVESNGRKFYASDAKLLASAEKMVCEEFAFVLGIEKNQVIPYIISLIKEQNSGEEPAVC